MPSPKPQFLTPYNTRVVSTAEGATPSNRWRNLLRFPVLEQAIRSCPDQYFVTLTSRRSLTPLAMTAEVGKVLHKVNAQLFGTHYSRKKAIRLATFTVHERTYFDGLHAHILVGVPAGSLTLKAQPATSSAGDLIVSEWIRADPETRRQTAQDCQEVYDFNGVFSYVRKGLRSRDDSDNVDVHNCFLPHFPSAPSSLTG